ncbi:MAG: cysteine hydrolase [Methanomassiliicoccales archaeon]|nr:cysteine hydrolase [Methanomassiliicoccales archaeon]
MKRAVLVVDMIHDFVYGKFGSERAQRVVPCVKELLARAREKGLPVIYLRDAHKKGDKELEVWGEHAMKGTKGSEIVPEIAPQKGDYVLEKTRYSSFHETGLDKLLDELGVKEVIVAGVTTDICVRHTAADAFFRGYSVTVPTECVQTISDEAQCNALDEMKKLYNAKVVSLSKVIL